MTFKVVRDSLGVAVAYGPDDDNYSPTLKAGEVLSVEDAAPSLAPAMPSSVSMAQARKALIVSGVSIASVDAAIAGIADATQKELAQTDWEYSTTVRRESPLVTSLGPILGLSDAQIDTLFVLADTL